MQCESAGGKFEMKYASRLVVIGFALVVTLVCEGVCSAEDLEGREVVVSVFRRHREKEGKLLEKVEAVVHARKIKLEIDDVNESTDFVVRGEDQSDSVVKAFFGDYKRLYDRNGLEFRLEVLNSELEGKEAVVRLYRDSGVYELVSAPVIERRIGFNFGDVGDDSAVALFGSDQEDAMLKLLLGHSGYAWAYKEGSLFHLPMTASGCNEQSLWWFLKDGLGNVFSGATADIYLVSEDRRVFISKAPVDERGGIDIGFCVGIGSATLEGRAIRRCLPAFSVSDAEYGLAEVRPWPCNTPYSCYVPLVRRNSEADARCIWGVVRDDQGAAVSGALIKGEALYPLGGEKVVAARCQKSFCRTDSQGRFRFYLPIDDDNLQIGTLIPPETNYQVCIMPPDGLGLLRFEGQIVNGRESEIVLDRGYFRRFVFEGDSGLISDQSKLLDVRVTIKQEGKTNLKMKYDDFKAGGIFPLGRFEARDRSHKFEPIEVTAESPEELVFKMRLQEIIYTGTIVNANSGKGMSGAFVIDLRDREEGIDPSGLSSEQWKALHGLGEITELRDKKLRKVLSPLHNKYYWFNQAVRSNPDGWFEIALPLGSRVEKLLLFEENFLSAVLPVGETKPDEDGFVDLGVTKLFPAGRVVFESWLDGVKGRRRILRQWFVDKTEPSEWIGELLNSQKREHEITSRRGFLFDLDEPCSFYVPAKVNILLQLRLWDEHVWSEPVFTEAFKLRQGQEIKLGVEQLYLASAVFVEVLDSSDKAIEGIPVTASHRYGEIIRNTDENGVAIFELARDSVGEFSVEGPRIDGSGLVVRESIPYDLPKLKDPNTVYTLRLSDEISYKSLK